MKDYQKPAYIKHPQRCSCGQPIHGEGRFCYRCSAAQLAALKLIVPTAAKAAVRT